MSRSSGVHQETAAGTKFAPILYRPRFFGTTGALTRGTSTETAAVVGLLAVTSNEASLRENHKLSASRNDSILSKTSSERLRRSALLTP